MTQSSVTPHSLCIIGAGIGGLKIAHRILSDRTVPIKSLILIDEKLKPGGAIETTCENGYVFEHAAQGVLNFKTAFCSTLEELHNEQKEKVIHSKPRLTRYLIWKDKLTPLSLNIFRNHKTGLLPIKAFLRAIGEVFQPKKTHMTLTESLWDFFARRFGNVFADHFLTPLSYGIWAGGAKKMLIRHVFPSLVSIENNHKSLIIFGIKTFISRLFSFSLSSAKKDKKLVSFNSGLEEFPRYLLEEIRKLCQSRSISLKEVWGARVTEIGYSDSLFSITLSDLSENSTFFSETVAMCVNSQAYETIHFHTSQESNKAWRNLSTLEKHSLCVVGLGGQYSGTQNSLTGFGALTSVQTKFKSLLGIIFVHDIFPSHVPTNSYLYRLMLGGEKDPHFCLKSDQEIIKLCRTILEELELISVNSKFEFTKVIRWNESIPIATEQQDAVLTSIYQLEHFHPGLFFCGNFIRGVGVDDVIQRAEHTALQIKNLFLQKYFTQNEKLSQHNKTE